MREMSRSDLEVLEEIKRMYQSGEVDRLKPADLYRYAQSHANFSGSQQTFRNYLRS